jgi:hypothetical protein
MSQPTVTWSVTGAIPFDDFQPGQGVTVGYRVHWAATNGATGYVFVSKASIGNTDMVRQLLADDVARVSAIHALSG